MKASIDKIGRMAWFVINSAMCDLTLFIFQISIGIFYLVHLYDQYKVIIGVLWLVIAGYHWMANKERIVDSVKRILGRCYLN